MYWSGWCDVAGCHETDKKSVNLGDIFSRAVFVTKLRSDYLII